VNDAAEWRRIPTQTRATDHGRTRFDERRGLLARVSHIKLMSDGKDQDEFFGGKPTPADS
jgi:hypothetical protein